MRIVPPSRHILTHRGSTGFECTGDGDFTCRLVTVAAGAASSAALGVSALAVVFAGASISTLGTAFFVAAPATPLSAVEGLISTTGGLEVPFSVAAADCAFGASAEDAAAFAFVSSFAAGFVSVLMALERLAAAASG